MISATQDGTVKGPRDHLALKNIWGTELNWTEFYKEEIFAFILPKSFTGEFNSMLIIKFKVLK